MPTGIRLLGGNIVTVAEDYDTVLGRFWPHSAPTSALEARTNAQYTQVGGDRVLIMPQNITGIVENHEDEDDE